MMLVFSLFVVLGTSMHAQANKAEKASVQALVAKVKKAPPSQRRVLMNELKIKLRSMQQATRTQVMLGLRQSFNAQHTQMGTKQMQANMHHQNTMSMTEAKHMQEHMNMDSMKPGQGPSNGNRPVQRPPNRNVAERPRPPSVDRPSVNPTSNIATQRPQGHVPNEHMPMGGM